MRLVAPGDIAPASINRYLLPRERSVITVHMHPAMLLGPLGIVLGGLVVAGVLTGSIAHGNNSFLDVIWAAWIIALLYFLWRVAEWSVMFFTVTNKRMILVRGLVVRRVAMMPLTKVTDMSFQRSASGRLFGYGAFVVESAGQDQAFRTVDFLPYPEQLYLEVCDLLFPDKADEGKTGTEVSCPDCRGTGRVRETRGAPPVTCRNCGGRGTVIAGYVVAVPDEKPGLNYPPRDGGDPGWGRRDSEEDSED